MKILYHHRIGSKDGQYVHIEEMVDALRADGHEVRVVGPEGFDQREFGGESGLVSRLKAGIPGSIYELLEVGYNALDYARLARAIREFRPDVIYERYNLSLLSGVMARRRLGIPLLLEVNAPLFAERSAYGGLKLARLARWTEHRAWRAADHVFVVTEVLADQIVDAGVERSRITVTPNGINHQRFAPAINSESAKKALGLDPQAMVIGFVGFAREWHGLDAVIELLAEYGDARPLHFLLVGDGPATAQLKQQAARVGVADRLTVTGVVERDDVQRYVKAFDVAMLPNVVAYASPLKLFEYMACSKAILAPNQANLREILTHDHDAVLFEPGSRDAFKATMRRLIEDDESRAHLACNARATLVARDLSWAANARHVAEIAGQLAEGRPRGIRGGG
ncbi:glycosyltransferase family 4 protein [Salinisphaera hydrothermalis]|uniref:glycosyltransferase family 4 protein n=1 Tax=Salinisphaera hydrothermalis TaxID=563188 RepID=UPI00334151A9